MDGSLRHRGNFGVVRDDDDRAALLVEVAENCEHIAARILEIARVREHVTGKIGDVDATEFRRYGSARRLYNFKVDNAY